MFIAHFTRVLFFVLAIFRFAKWSQTEDGEAQWFLHLFSSKQYITTFICNVLDVNSILIVSFCDDSLFHDVVTVLWWISIMIFSSFIFLQNSATFRTRWFRTSPLCSYNSIMRPAVSSLTLLMLPFPSPTQGPLSSLLAGKLSETAPPSLQALSRVFTRRGETRKGRERLLKSNHFPSTFLPSFPFCPLPPLFFLPRTRNTPRNNSILFSERCPDTFLKITQETESSAPLLKLLVWDIQTTQIISV